MCGQLSWQGHNLHSLLLHQRVQLGLGYVPEDRRIFAKLSVADNLRVAIKNPKDLVQRLDYVYDIFPELYDIRQRIGGLLSGGQQQMLCVARTLMGNPQLLLLDEPSEGLAPLLVERMREALQQLKQDGLSMLVAEQSLSLCLPLCDDFLVLQQGRVLDQLDNAAARNNPERMISALRL